ncbi:MAG TPA: bifunctional (p)ppGpp synthetase/guanosine-3',5'-bis(diphosphate) 3'-pyrophosphohydrolase [Candidatus Caccomonas pullistercoris]|nr:bifunctional (p)ppGpp synthetase/guanosine-3',5'-bis(diphosphate) 3'-pyrophosphohydrolase [Candidatus Caccomonas pullistercoris]
MTAEKPFFTPEEHAELLSLFRTLRQADADLFARKNYRLLRDRIEQSARGCTLSRDTFGLNPVITSLQTAILAASEIGMRGDALTACLVQPSLPPDADLAPVGETFGQGVATVLHGLRRVSQLYAKTPSIQSDNFRNLLVSFAEDMRVVLLIIASRVNLMRHIKNNPNQEAVRSAATEASYLYAPLAHKLGLYQLKSELEDLSLKYLEHDAYYMIKDKLNATKATRDAYIERFIAPIQDMLTHAGLRFHIKGRTKSIHSIWQKMKKQHCPFEGVYDLFAIRIIIDAPREKEKQQCWQAYSLITDRYQPNPKRLRDWLSIPKSNGYESLHITVLGPENKWVEVQIRTERMDEIAEHGLAAHWRYKGVRAGDSSVDEWLANIRSALETGDDLQLMDQFKTGLTEDEVYVFTPKGDLLKFPKGATVLDFAYHIHTNVGNRCVGGRINGRNVPMRQALVSGDTIEVLTSNTQHPKLEWTKYVATGRAKAKIRQSVKEEQAKEGLMARELLERKLKNRKIEWDESAISALVRKTGFKEASEFYKALAEERLSINELIDTYVELYRHENNLLERQAARSAEEFTFEANGQHKAQGDDDVLVIDQNLKGIDFQLARCCRPVYGDDIFGFVTVNGGIKIHRTNCPNAQALRERFGYRIVKARWAGKGSSQYAITLHVVGHDDLGIVNNITSIISKEANVSLRSISIDSNDGLFSGILTVMVDDTRVLTALIKKLRTVKGVKAVTRS